jgi:hypothetical protein
VSAADVGQMRSALAHPHLAQIARTLNSLRDLGVPVTLRHGVLMTDCGYVIPDDDGHWSTRMKIYDPHMQPVGDPDDD